MRAVIKAMDFDPEPATLPADPARLHLLVQLLVGPSDGPGAESFQVTVCSPEWLAVRCREVDGIYDPRHHLVVNLEFFDKRKLRQWFEGKVQKVEAPEWAGIGERLSRIGYWEFEDYQP